MLISPGVMKSSSNLLKFLHMNTLDVNKFLNLNVSFDVFGRASRSRVLELCQEANWISVDENGQMRPTQTGLEIINQKTEITALRHQLRTIIFHTQPPWAKTIQYGRKELLNTVGPDIRQCFIEAALSEGWDEETVIWWDILAQAARGNTADELLSIGRRGEKKSIEFETKRVGVEPKYTALESSYPGYDILSQVSCDNDEKLSIEVKSSEKGLNYATFHLSRNEFEKALISKNYLFHLWLLSDEDRNEPCICTVQEVAKHCPSDKGQGRWESVEIPFNIFSWG